MGRRGRASDRDRIQLAGQARPARNPADPWGRWAGRSAPEARAGAGAGVPVVAEVTPAGGNLAVYCSGSSRHGTRQGRPAGARPICLLYLIPVVRSTDCCRYAVLPGPIARRQPWCRGCLASTPSRCGSALRICTPPIASHCLTNELTNNGKDRHVAGNYREHRRPLRRVKESAVLLAVKSHASAHCPGRPSADMRPWFASAPAGLASSAPRAAIVTPPTNRDFARSPSLQPDITHCRCFPAPAFYWPWAPSCPAAPF